MTASYAPMRVLLERRGWDAAHQPTRGASRRRTQAESRPAVTDARRVAAGARSQPEFGTARVRRARIPWGAWTPRPGLDPAVAEVRLAVRACADRRSRPAGRSSWRCRAAPTRSRSPPPPRSRRPSSACASRASRSITVCRTGSADAAAAAAARARALGLEARVVRVDVGDDGGPEAAARAARYAALAAAASDLGAACGAARATRSTIRPRPCCSGLARGSGAASLQGMAAGSDLATGIALLRPLLDVRRATTRAACAAEGLDPWDDPHNADPRFARVRVRETVLPVLEAELGPGDRRGARPHRRAAARRRRGVRRDDRRDDRRHRRARRSGHLGVGRGARGESRRRCGTASSGTSSRPSSARASPASQTLEVARLVTDWSGQGPIDLPGCRARRIGGRVEFTAS